MGDVIIPDERIQEYEEKKRARENKKKRLSQDRMRDRDEVEIDRSDGDDDKEEKTTTKKKSSPLKLYVIFEHEINQMFTNNVTLEYYENSTRFSNTQVRTFLLRSLGTYACSNHQSIGERISRTYCTCFTTWTSALLLLLDRTYGRFLYQLCI